jgi:large repetitive protein
VNMGGGEYVTSLLGGALGGSIYFGATGTSSSMTMSGNTVTITLGTYSAESILVGRITAATAGSMIWTPVATPFDRAANPMSTTPATQSGGAKKEF